MDGYYIIKNPLSLSEKDLTYKWTVLEIVLLEL